ncbi:AI-2E family transporter [Gulosibacter sp. ACHW.36C]|uniref:AI-2E family transporter n=1 Tax=Gulosibacter sediminis TaxID=1729695 RepID=A0ABY4N039_9MICO|nr:AI-2E family transporter [Gulosibacter sediminis]UQN14996.1 AI-2E family transporter [Gulosibacter sediminis]
MPLADSALEDRELDAQLRAKAQEQERQGRLVSPRRPAQLWTDSVGVVATRSLQGLLILAAFSILVIGMLNVSIVVVPILLALIVASAFEPVISALGRHGWPRVLSTVIVLLLVVVVFGGLIWIVVMQVMDQWDDLSSTAVEGFNQLVAWWNNQFPQFALDDERLNDLWATVQSLLENINFGAVGSGLASGLSAFGNFAMAAVLFVVILFFFLKDGPSIWSFIVRPLPTNQHRRAELMGARAVGVMGGYVRGTVIVALVDAVFIGLGMVILGVPLWLPLALVVFICAFIPVVGATLAGIIAALVTLVTNGFVPAIVVVGIVVLVNQLEGNLLQPVVLGKSLKLHELVVLIALTTGTVLGGIMGTLIAVPLTAVAWALIKAWNESLPELEAQQEDDTIRARLRERWRRAERED